MALKIPVILARELLLSWAQKIIHESFLRLLHIYLSFTTELTLQQGTSWSEKLMLQKLSTRAAPYTQLTCSWIPNFSDIQQNFIHRAADARNYLDCACLQTQSTQISRTASRPVETHLRKFALAWSNLGYVSKSGSHSPQKFKMKN